ncbi:MAG: M13 family metallopeptidase [Gammaproteobacteria bacterium]
MSTNTPPGRIQRPTIGTCIWWTVWAAALPAAALSSWLVSPAHAQAIESRAPWALEKGVDASIKPGDDFFAYANGAWLAATEIPAGKERWNARTEIDELTHQQVAKLLDDARDAPAGSMARKVADFRAAWLNEAAIEAKGIKPLEPLLNRIGQLRDKTALMRILGSELRADVDPLGWGIYNSSRVLGLSVEPGNGGEKTYVAFLLQGGLGLPDREHYISTEPGMQALRAQYLEYIGQMLTLAGFDRAAERAQGVMALETALAQSHATRETSAKDHNADNLWTRADFAREAPGMDWSAFFAAAGLSRQETFVAWQPTAVKGVAALVASQPLRAWQDYLRFHEIHAYADVLPHAFAERAMALRSAAAKSPPPQSSRAQRAVDATQSALSEALGRLYVERHFPAEYKARVQDIVAHVVAAFRQRVQALTWMSPHTRAVALTKLKTLYVGVGYPEKWQDYSDLAVDPADAAGNLRRVTDRNYRQALARLSQPVDKTQWLMAPHAVGAILTFQQNAYDFSAGLLQAPKFDPAASEAANYGAIGAIIGHDVSHFIDTLGAEYETDGRNRRWWTPEDSAQYAAVTQPLVDQFSGYRPFPDLGVNGKLTLSENLADLGGLAAAFDAYRRTLGNRIADEEYVRAQDRQFFIGFARGWRSKIREDALRTQLATNDHAPESFRISTVRNIDAWYDAFDVLPGQRLYLEPKARVRIW